MSDDIVHLASGRIPSLHIVANNIPSAHYRAIRAVLSKGVEKRTQYDKRNADGSYMHPAGRDADVTIEILNPLAQPRISPVSYVEIGKYIAEMLGVKDHLVPPREKLLASIAGKLKLEATEDPYTYHLRLRRKPTSEGIVDELGGALDRLVASPISRRAVADTAIPEIDVFLKEDIPCLRELQLRLQKNSQGIYVLNVHSHFRSHDLKAWGDNMLGITDLIQIEAIPYLEAKLGEKVVMGSWKETNGSLHIYGQDLVDPGKAMDRFVEVNPTERVFMKTAKKISEAYNEGLIDDHLAVLLEERAQWNFPEEQVKLLENLRVWFKEGRFTP